MASGNKSRWGSLLSQAVAGVESRLDTILGDENEASKDSKTTQQTTTPAPPAPSSAKPSPGMSLMSGGLQLYAYMLTWLFYSTPENRLQ